MNRRSGSGLRWVPLLGDFDLLEDEVRFKGRLIPAQLPPAQATSAAPPPESPPMQELAGLLVSNAFASDGRLRATVAFKEVAPATTFELALFINRDRRHFVTVGLGALGWAFAIREFAPPDVSSVEPQANQWKVHRGEGERSFLVPERPYALEVKIAGGTVSMCVDGVPVLSTPIRFPRGGALQVGMFFQGQNLIEVTDIDFDVRKPRAFVVMQFDGVYEELYRYVIREICEEFEIAPLKADEMVGPGVIMEDIVREIEAARIVVADITPANPNVYFEVGYARALGKPIILLARKGTPLPFDVAGFRVLFYEDSIGGKARLDDSLRKHVAEVLG